MKQENKQTIATIISTKKKADKATNIIEAMDITVTPTVAAKVVDKNVPIELARRNLAKLQTHL